jgi:hypothetical protein
MKSHVLGVCAALLTVFVFAQQTRCQTSPGAGEGDIIYSGIYPGGPGYDSQQSPFLPSDQVGDGMGDYTIATYDLSALHFDIGFSQGRLGAQDRGSTARGYQFFQIIDPVLYTLSGNFSYSTTSGVSILTGLSIPGASLVSVEYLASNETGGPAGTVPIGPVSGELPAGSTIQFNWYTNLTADVQPDDGATMTGNISLTFTAVPEPTFAGSTLATIALLARRRRWRRG